MKTLGQVAWESQHEDRPWGILHPDHQAWWEKIARDVSDAVLLRCPLVNTQLLASLQNLVDDTQHCDHDCGDADCPVRQAREAIKLATT